MLSEPYFVFAEPSWNLPSRRLTWASRASLRRPSRAACRCVKTKRLDVAEVCLGHMGHARGAAAVRESRKEGSVELSIGVLATELGLLDDAARLFRESGRYDYLNKLFQAAGLWPKAIKVAKGNDRIHLKNTHYQFAKHLESIGDIDRAIEHYERSETARTEVPRMLFSLGRTEVKPPSPSSSPYLSPARAHAEPLPLDPIHRPGLFYHMT